MKYFWTAFVAAALLLAFASAAPARTYLDPPTKQVVIAADGGDGFQWLDAGIGAVSALGLGLAAAGTSVLVLRHRRRAAFS
jgi:hypothetical protein